MKEIRELIIDICKAAFEDAEWLNQGMDDYRLGEWLDENSKFRTLKERITGYSTGYNTDNNINMKVKDLQAILINIEDKNMDVIIPVLDVENDKIIHGFRHVRTAGILSNKYEPGLALCLSAPGDGMDIESQLDYNHRSDTECERVWF